MVLPLKEVSNPLAAVSIFLIPHQQKIPSPAPLQLKMVAKSNWFVGNDLNNKL